MSLELYSEGDKVVFTCRADGGAEIEIYFGVETYDGVEIGRGGFNHVRLSESAFGDLKDWIAKQMRESAR